MRTEYTKDLVISDGVWVDARAYGGDLDDVTIFNALSDIGSDNKVLILSPGAWSIDPVALLTIPSNIILKVMTGALLTIAAGKSLVINGGLEAELHQIFAGTGTVSFGRGVVAGVYPQWWGGYNDDTHAAETYAAISAAIASLGTYRGNVYFTSGVWLVDTRIVTTYADLIGLGEASIHYSGADCMIEISGGNNVILENLFLTPPKDTTSDGIKITGISRYCKIRGVHMQPYGGVSTGIGIHIAPGVTGFVTVLHIEDVYIAHFKYGIKNEGDILGHPAGRGQSTYLTFENVFITGGLAVGSIGLWMDAEGNGAGTTFTGIFESQETGFQHDEGSHGARILAYFEGNTTDWTVGASFQGSIKPSYGVGGEVDNYELGALRAYKEKIMLGQYWRETYYDQKHVLYGYGAHPEFSVYIGASLIDGNLPSRIWGISSRGSAMDVNPHTNYMDLLGHKFSYSTSVPTLGSWGHGDVIFNATPTVGVQSGWVCIHSGTFGAATDATGDTDGSTAVITGMADTSDFEVDSWVDVSAGFPTTGPYRIRAKTATTLTLDTNSDAIAANITVDTSDPTFAEFGNVELTGSVVWDPGDLADGAGETSAGITVTGAALGDYVLVAAPYDLQDLICTGYVQAANTIEIRIQNENAGANVNLGSGTWKVRVIKA